LPGISSILARKQNSRGQSIRFCHNPESLASLCTIGGQEAQGESERKLIFAPILFAEITPVAGLMAGKRLEHIFRWDGFHNSRCLVHIAKFKQLRYYGHIGLR